MLEEPVGTVEFQPSPFFAEQLRAFELWLEHGSQQKRPPEQLPIVLQACTHVRSCSWSVSATASKIYCFTLLVHGAKYSIGVKIDVFDYP